MRYLFILFIALPCNADNSKEAIRTASKAFLKTDQGKTIKKNAESKTRYIIERYVGENNAAIAGVLADVAITGRIDSGKFNTKIKLFDKTYVNPHIVYDINNSEASGLLTIDIKY